MRHGCGRHTSGFTMQAQERGKAIQAQAQEKGKTMQGQAQEKGTVMQAQAQEKGKAVQAQVQEHVTDMSCDSTGPSLVEYALSAG